MDNPELVDNSQLMDIFGLSDKDFDIENLDLEGVPILISELSDDITQLINKSDNIYSKEAIILDELKTRYNGDKNKDELNIDIINKLSRKANLIVKLIELSQYELTNTDLNTNPFKFNLVNNINNNISYITLGKKKVYNPTKIKNVFEDNPDDDIEKFIENNSKIENTRKKNGSVEFLSNLQDLNDLHKTHVSNWKEDLNDIPLSYNSIDNKTDIFVKYLSIDNKNQILYNGTLDNCLAEGDLTYLTNVYDLNTLENMKKKVQICNGTSKNDRAFVSFTEDGQVNDFNKPMSKPSKYNILKSGDKINIVGIQFNKHIPSFTNNSNQTVSICGNDNTLNYSNGIRNNNISKTDFNTVSELDIGNFQSNFDINNGNFAKLFINNSLNELSDAEYHQMLDSCLPNIDNIEFNDICSIKDINNILKNYGLSDKNINSDLNRKLSLNSLITQNIIIKKNRIKNKNDRTKRIKYIYNIFKYIHNYLINKIKEQTITKKENIHLSIKNNIEKIFKIYGYDPEKSTKSTQIIKNFIRFLNKIYNKNNKILLSGDIIQNLSKHYNTFINNSFNNYHYLSEYRHYLSNPIINDLYSNIAKYYDTIPINNRLYMGNKISYSDQLNIELMSAINNIKDKELLETSLKLIELYKSENDMNEDIEELAFESYTKNSVGKLDLKEQEALWEKMGPNEKSVYLSTENINEINKVYDIEKRDLINNINQSKFRNDYCNNFKIVKIYDSIDKLKSDNGHDSVYYDDEFDNSKQIYDLIKLKLKNNAVDINNLREEFGIKYKFSVNSAHIETLFNNARDNDKPNKQRVVENSYGILLDQSRKVLYRRMGNIWLPLNKEDIISSSSLCERELTSINDSNYRSFLGKCELQKDGNGDYCINKELVQYFNSLKNNSDKIENFKVIAESLKNIKYERETLINQIEYFSQKMLFKKISSFNEEPKVDVIDNQVLPSEKLQYELNTIFNETSTITMFEKLKEFYRKNGDYTNDSKYIKWKDPSITTNMMCKHYMEYANLMTNNDKDKNKSIQDLIFNWGDSGDSEFVHCRNCGASIIRKDYIEIESFGEDNRPIQFREKVIEIDKDINPYNKVTQKNNYTIYEIIRVYSEQLNLQPKISDDRISKLIELINNIKTSKDIEFSDLTYILSINAQEIPSNNYEFSPGILKLGKNNIQKQFNFSKYTDVYTAYKRVYSTFNNNIEDIINNLDNTTLKTNEANDSINSEKKKNIKGLLDLLSKKTKIHGITIHKIFIDLINTLYTVYSDYANFNLIMKTIVVFTHEIVYNDFNGTKYEIMPTGNERLGGLGKETTVDLRQGDYNLISDLVLNIYKNLSQQQGSILNHVISTNIDKSVKFEPNYVKKDLISEIETFLKSRPFYRDKIIKGKPQVEKIKRADLRKLYIKNWDSFKPSLFFSPKRNANEGENKDKTTSDMINNIKLYTQDYIDSLTQSYNNEQNINSKSVRKSLIIYDSNNSSKLGEYDDVKNKEHLEKIDLLNKSISERLNKTHRFITYDKNDIHYIHDSYFSSKQNLSETNNLEIYLDDLKLLKTYIFENGSFFGKKRIFTKNINYDLERFNRIPATLDENLKTPQDSSIDYKQLIKEEYFKIIDNEYKALFSQKEKEFKYYLCDKNIDIYNYDTLSKSNILKINMFLALTFYKTLYDKLDSEAFKDENLEKYYKALISLTKTETHDCNNKIIINNGLYISNSQLIEIIKWFSSDWEHFKTINLEKTDENKKIELMKIFKIYFYEAHIIYNFFVNNANTSIIYKNLKLKINENNISKNFYEDKDEEDNLSDNDNENNETDENIKGNIQILIKFITNNINIFASSGEQKKYLDVMNGFLNSIGLAKNVLEEETENLKITLNIEGEYGQNLEQLPQYIKRAEKLKKNYYINGSNQLKEFILLLNYYVEFIKNLMSSQSDINSELSDRLNRKYLKSWNSQNQEQFKKYDQIISNYDIINLINEFKIKKDPDESGDFEEDDNSNEDDAVFTNYTPINYNMLNLYTKTDNDAQQIYTNLQNKLISQLILIKSENSNDFVSRFIKLYLNMIMKLGNINNSTNNEIAEIIDKVKTKKNNSRLARYKNNSNEQKQLHSLFRGSNLGKLSSLNLETEENEENEEDGGNDDEEEELKLGDGDEGNADPEDDVIDNTEITDNIQEHHDGLLDDNDIINGQIEGEPFGEMFSDLFN